MSANNSLYKYKLYKIQKTIVKIKNNVSTTSPKNTGLSTEHNLE